MIEQISQSKKVTKAQVSLAWVLCQNNDIIAIPSTRKVHRLKENLGAFHVELTPTDLEISQKSIPTETTGNRH